MTTKKTYVILLIKRYLNLLITFIQGNKLGDTFLYESLQYIELVQRDNITTPIAIMKEVSQRH